MAFFQPQGLMVKADGERTLKRAERESSLLHQSSNGWPNRPCGKASWHGLKSLTIPSASGTGTQRSGN